MKIVRRIEDQSEMHLYRLTPINSRDRSWQGSVHRQTAIIRAGSEDDARTLALKAFHTPLLPSAPGRAVDVAPWREAEAVRVEVIQDQRYSAKGPAGILEPWGYS